MRTLFLTVVLSGLAGNAAAEWTLISEGANNNLYADFATVRRSGGNVKVWTLSDRAKATMSPGNPAKTYRSMVTLQEVDCSDEKMRALQLTTYENGMGAGKQLDFATRANNPSWQYAEPGTVAEDVVKAVCKK
ncbi:surface-adhesin E family protein [Massilia sp. PWRC2]|uniref:surface-adhesin E family protein n=1 Tax=Massilia sp. PWRC2 TaxID=2804626 RepID=UPI003CF28020